MYSFIKHETWHITMQRPYDKGCKFTQQSNTSSFLLGILILIFDTLIPLASGWTRLRLHSIVRHETWHKTMQNLNARAAKSTKQAHAPSTLDGLLNLFIGESSILDLPMLKTTSSILGMWVQLQWMYRSQASRGVESSNLIGTQLN